MTDAEALGKALLEKKEILDSLKGLRIRADRFGQQFLALGHLLKGDAAGAVFDDQPSRAGVSRGHFNSHECDIAEVKELVAKIREKEERLHDLDELLK